MSGLKTIRRRIASVKNTKQITRAMKLVSAAKLRRAQELAETGAAFSSHLDRVVATVLSGVQADFQHPLLEKRREINKQRFVVISGERGLCGGYNANVIKAVQGNERISLETSEFVCIGRRTVSAARRLGWNIVAEHEQLAEDATKWPIDDIAETLIRDFSSGRCDEVVIYYTRFVSALNQQVTRVPLLPLGSLTPVEEFSRDVAEGHRENSEVPGVVGFSPKPEEILRSLIPLLIKTKLYQAGLQAKASEHAARMTAMDAATNNANDLIDKLRLFYNRARQSTITRELIDIIGGAEAIND